MSGAARWIAAVALLVLSGACRSTDEGPGLRRVGAALGLSSGDAGACASIAFEGCCHGETLYYCKSGKILVLDCSQDPSCGWDSAASYYNCKTNGQADPGGTYPKACDFGDAGPPDIGPSNPCGNVTFEGCCHGETLYFCAGGLTTADCTANPSCGWNTANSYYDCGTTGQADPSGAYPKACVFDAAVPDIGPVPDVAAVPDVAPVPCGNITWQGCCDGETLKYCDNGLKTIDCTANPSCGWEAVYHSFYDCGTSGKPDPSGVHPKACADLPDGSATAQDGFVPCGNVKWEGCCHGELSYYCENGLQVQDCRRAPSCGWNTYENWYRCGSDGAEDPKGAKPKACAFGDAGPPVVSNNCGSLTWQGCCDGQTVLYCNAGTLKWEDCGNAPYCGWKTDGAYSFYACGTSGKADPGGQLPKACPSDAGVPDAAPTCGPVTQQGCCEGETLYYCAAGVLKTLDCAKSPSCGWQEAFGYYDCNTDGAADPLGEHPMACGFDGGVPVPDGPRDAASTDRSVHDSAGDAAPPTDSGCGCALVPRSPGGVTLLLLLALVITLRRRP